MTEAVFTPLGMTSSSYVWRPDFDVLTATGHEADGKPAKLWKPNEAGAASTLNTTAKDYALFVDAILNGKGLKRSTLHEMETPRVDDPQCRICINKYRRCYREESVLGIGLGIQLRMEAACCGIGETTGYSRVS